MWVSVVIPALNEEEPISEVVREVIATGIPREVVVVDNGSTDQTAECARNAGARVVSAPRGYGRACAAGVAAVSDECDVLVFLDGDSVLLQGVPQGEQIMIRHQFRQATDHLEGWMELAATVMAETAGNVSVVTAPRLAR